MIKPVLTFAVLVVGAVGVHMMPARSTGTAPPANRKPPVIYRIGPHGHKRKVL